VKRRVMAVKSFHGRRRFDTVSLTGEGSQVWYAQLLAIFKTATSSSLYEVAFIRWYEEVERRSNDKHPFARIKLVDKYQVRIMI